MSKSLRSSSSTAKAIKSAGFHDISMIQQAAASLSDPSELAELLQIDSLALDSLLGQKDLGCINGLGDIYLDLLLSTGISTVEELSQCNPFELHDAIRATSKQHQVSRVPNRATIEDWIEQARIFSRVS